MPNENKPLLRQLNPFLDLSFSNISTDCCGYHSIATWPCNIMVLVLKNNDKGHDYYENLEENQRLPIKANHVYFIPCGLKMKFEESSERTVISLHFNLTFFHGIDVFSGVTHCEMRHAPKMVAFFQSLLNEEKDELKAICELKAEVMRFCASCWPKGLERLLPVIRKYEPIFRYVREQGDADLTVAALAKMAGQRQNVFSRNFRRDIGKPPKEFIRDDLLKKITTRLLNPRMNVKETAYELNFGSEFYMSRFFKKHTGLSPSAYQRQFRR